MSQALAENQPLVLQLIEKRRRILRDRVLREHPEVFDKLQKHRRKLEERLELQRASVEPQEQAPQPNQTFEKEDVPAQESDVAQDSDAAQDSDVAQDSDAAQDSDVAQKEYELDENTAEQESNLERQFLEYIRRH